MIHKPMRSLVFVFIAIGIVVSLIACSSGSELQILTHTITVREFTGNLNITQSMATVTGTARNASDTVIRDCVVNVTYYDAQKNVVGVSSANKELLNHGEVWGFTVQLTGSDAWKVLSYDIAAHNQ